MNKPILHVHFDMDGVLVHFDEQDSITKPFMELGSHYFLHQAPDTKAVDLMRALDEFPRVRTHVLTRLFPDLDDDVADEQEADKLAWCRNTRLSAGFEPGREAPFACLRGTPDKNAPLLAVPKWNDRAYHILIDDDRQVLRDWEAIGGVGFQYRQYRRTCACWHRGLLTWDMPMAEMAAAILKAPYDPGPSHREPHV